MSLNGEERKDAGDKEEPLLPPAAAPAQQGDACASFGAALCGVGCVAVLGFTVLLIYQLTVN